MKKLYLYFHAGSKNHGCEAIVRSTQALTGRVPVLISANPEQDICYQINQIVELPTKLRFKINNHTISMDAVIKEYGMSWTGKGETSPVTLKVIGSVPKSRE